MPYSAPTICCKIRTCCSLSDNSEKLGYAFCNICNTGYNTSKPIIPLNGGKVFVLSVKRSFLPKRSCASEVDNIILFLTNCIRGSSASLIRNIRHLSPAKEVAIIVKVDMVLKATGEDNIDIPIVYTKGKDEFDNCASCIIKANPLELDSDNAMNPTYPSPANITNVP